MSKKAYVFFAEGFETVEALIPVDVLIRAGVELTTVGIGTCEITSAHGVTVKTDIEVNELSESADAYILPGGMPGSVNLAASSKLEKIIREAHSAGKIIASVCAAPAKTLAQWGVLSGKKATCYPGFEKEFPDDVQPVKDCVAVDGNVITSRGPGTSFELAYTLAEILADKETSTTLRERMLYSTCK